MRYFLPFCLLLILVVSCNPDDEMEIKPFDSYGTGAYVVNRGTAGVSTGSISHYLSGCLQGKNNIFEEANGFSFPEELRDMTFTGSGQVLLLTPKQIIIATADDFVQQTTIGGFDNARQIQLISPDIAYVSQYNAPGQGHGIKVVQLSTGQIIQNLLPGKSTDKMLVAGTAVYASNTGGNFIDSTIAKIDAIGNQLINYIEVGKRPTNLGIDANGSLWVLCEGVINNLVNPEAPENVPGALVRLTNDQIISSFALGSGARNLVVDRNGENLFYVNRNWTYKLPITAAALPLIPFVTTSFNGYDMDPATGLLYGSNAGNFIEDGTIWVYNTNTQDTIGTFIVGNAPLEVVFRQ